MLNPDLPFSSRTLIIKCVYVNMLFGDEQRQWVCSIFWKRCNWINQNRKLVGQTDKQWKKLIIKLLKSVCRDHTILSTDLICFGTTMFYDFNIRACCPSNHFSLQFLDLITFFKLIRSVKGTSHSGGHTLDLVNSASIFTAWTITLEPRKRQKTIETQQIANNTWFPQKPNAPLSKSS